MACAVRALLEAVVVNWLDRASRAGSLQFKTGYTHMARVALNFGVGGHFGAVQWMDLQLSPTTTITIFLTKRLQARVVAAPRVLRARGVLPIGMRKARAGSKNRGRRHYSRHGGTCW